METRNDIGRTKSNIRLIVFDDVSIDDRYLNILRKLGMSFIYHKTRAGITDYLNNRAGKNNEMICLVSEDPITNANATNEGFRIVNAVSALTAHHVLSTCLDSINQQAAIDAIDHYLQNVLPTGCTAYFYSRETGRNRGNTFLCLLKNLKFIVDPSEKAFMKNVILLALFSSKGPTLQKYVSAQMGFNDAKEAKDYFQIEVKENLDNTELEDEINSVFDTVVPAIAEQSDSGATTDKDILRLLEAIPNTYFITSRQAVDYVS